MERTRRKMMNRRNRPSIRLRLRTAILLILVMVAVTGSSVWHIWQLHGQVEGQLSQLKLEKDALLQQERTLRDEIEQLNTPSYIEKLAREQLGLVKKGEILISPKN